TRIVLAASAPLTALTGAPPDNQARTLMALLARRRHRSAGGHRGFGLGGWLEDPVHGPWNAVLVGAADDRRHRIEVEDRRRRGDLPLERQPAPRVRGGPWAAPPAGHDVVKKDQRAKAEDERRDRD